MQDVTPGPETPNEQTASRQSVVRLDRQTAEAETTSSAKPPGLAQPSSIDNACDQTFAVPGYGALYFDHLYGEYVVLKPLIKDAQVLRVLEEIVEKRRQCELRWSDVYTFDLAMVRVRPPVSLIRKAYDARARYRSIAGQKEYDEYVASNPPNLVEIKVAPGAQPPQPDEIVENALRADVEYLLNKFYLYYGTLPARESLRDKLTSRAVRRTLMFVGVLGALMLVNLGVISIFKSLDKVFDVGAAARPGLTVLTVALAGIVGGCVSTLQRIQSAPSEGDALFNLAALNNGWTGLSLSPLYGGIFAALLFVLFAAGILKGSVFPEIHTPAKRGPGTNVVSPSTPPSAASNTPASAPNASAATPPPTANAPAATATSSPTIPIEKRQAEVVETTAPTHAAPEPDSILRVKTFLEETGPVDGVSYALLIVWSFLAGFAERLVPDTLNRLVAKNQAIQGQ